MCRPKPPGLCQAMNGPRQRFPKICRHRPESLPGLKREKQWSNGELTSARQPDAEGQKSRSRQKESLLRFVAPNCSDTEQNVLVITQTPNPMQTKEFRIKLMPKSAA